MFSLLRVIVPVHLAIASLVVQDSSSFMIHNTNLETRRNKSLLQKNHLSYTFQPYSSSSSSFSSPSKIALNNGNGSDDDRDGDEDGDDDNNGDLMNQHYYPAYGGEASVELNDEDDDDDEEMAEVSTTSVNNIIQDSCGNDYDDDGDERLQKSSRYWRNLFTKFFSN